LETHGKEAVWRMEEAQRKHTTNPHYSQIFIKKIANNP